MKRALFLIGGGLAALIGVYMIATTVAAGRDHAAFEEQLRLARTEGLATTGEEYGAAIPTAAPAENAAPFYRKLKPLLKEPDKVTTVGRELASHPTDANRAAAKQLLIENRDALDILDEAVKLPKCWFDRDWHKGEAPVLMPEYSDLKRSARLLSVRGALAADRGDVQMALADANRIAQISKHSGIEGNEISQLVSEAISIIHVRCLAYWAYEHPDVPAYREAYLKAVDAFPRPNLRAEHRGDLCNILSLIQLTLTPEGRKDLGLKESDISPAEKILPIFLSRPKAKIDIVKAERAYWKALSLPPAQQKPLAEAATNDLNKALLSYPTAADIYFKLSSGFDSIDHLQTWEARHQQYVALGRALSVTPIPRAIDTKGLASPFDGKPIRYRYDGKQIAIEVSGYESDSKPILLKLPPDKMPN